MTNSFLDSALYYPFIRCSYSEFLVTVHLGTGMLEHARWI